MLISMREHEKDALIRWLNANEDAQATGDGSYTIDLFDSAPPVSMELMPTKDGVDALAVLELKYDEQLDGWFLGEKIKDARLIGDILKKTGAY